MKDVARSYDTLTHLLERIHFFLQRLNRYTGVPLTDDIVELLGRIMAQVLSILALSTKAMMNGRISGSNHLFYTPFLVDGYHRDVSEETDGKDGCRRCGCAIGHAHEGREPDDGGSEFGGCTLCRSEI